MNIPSDDWRERLNATCPTCGADIFDELVYCAHQNSLESAILVGCPNCNSEIGFHVEWNIELRKAEVVTCYPQPEGP